MAARKARDQLLHDFAGGAVAGIPGHRQGTVAVIIARQAGNVVVAYRALVHPAARPGRFAEPARRVAEPLDRLAEERLSLKDDLEAVVIGRIVRSGDHDPAVDRQGRRRVVQHRRRPAADAHDIGAFFGKALDERRFELRRG